MADLAIQTNSVTGISPSYVTANSAGDTFSNDGRTLLYVKNGGTASITVTATGTGKCNMGFTHDLSVDVAAGETEIIGPFNWQRFNDDQQKVSVSYTDVTSVQVAAIRMDV